MNKIGELKKAVDFYVEEHGKDFPLKEIEISMHVGYKCPPKGWIVIAPPSNLDDFENEDYLRGSDAAIDGIVRQFNLLIEEAQEGKELSGVVSHKGLQELREVIHAKFKS